MEFSLSVPLLKCSEERAEGGRRAEKAALLEPPRQLVRPHHGPAGGPHHGPAGGPHYGPAGGPQWSRGRSGAVGFLDFHGPLSFPRAHSGILSSGREATKDVAKHQEDGEAIAEDRQHVPQGHEALGGPFASLVPLTERASSPSGSYAGVQELLASSPA